MRAPDLGPLFSTTPQDHAYDVYRELRETAPVLQVPGTRTWLFSTYEDVRGIVRDPATWANHHPVRFGGPPDQASPRSGRMEAALAEGYPWAPLLLFQNGPEHRRRRAALQRALSATGVHRLEADIADIAHGLVDGFAANGRVMFVRDFGTPLPIQAFARAFGADPADPEPFIGWSDSIVRLDSPMDEADSVRSAESYVEFQHFMVERIRERRAAGTGDLLSDLVATHLSDDDDWESGLPELLGLLALLLAGTETTTATMSSLLHRMINDPRLMATLRENRSHIPAAVEETLRLDSPVQTFQRRAMRDVETGGYRIKRGDVAIILYASANRDPAHWTDPDEFRLGRPNIKDHLAFTHGPHHCAGAALSRAMARIGFEVLLDRISDIDPLDGAPVEFLPVLNTRAYAEIPLVVSKPSARRRDSD